jgi:enoyl-CoA hydratase/carnithine racemase
MTGSLSRLSTRFAHGRDDEARVAVASKPRMAIKMGKETFYEQIDMPLAEAYDYALRIMTENMLNAEACEGVCAFLQKRKLNWPA